MILNRCSIIVIVVLGFLTLAYFWWDEPCKNLNDGNYTKQIENLQKQNDSLRANNHQLDVKVRQLKSEADSLKGLVQTDQQVIKELKKKEREKVKAIRNFNHDELLMFFAELEFEADSTTD